MIGDRDKIWTSRFWQELNRLMNIQVNLSTAHHPQTDGRSERLVKTVNQILRHMAASKHGKWLESLPALEFAINSAVNSAKGIAPFEFVLGQKPRLFPIRTETMAVGEDVNQWLEDRRADWQEWRDRLWESRVDQAVQYNHRRRQEPEIKVGDRVLVNSKDRPQAVSGRGRGTAKLQARFDGPYEVIKVTNDGRNCRLALPEDDKSHPNFHVSKLKIYRELQEGGPEGGPRALSV